MSVHSDRVEMWYWKLVIPLYSWLTLYNIAIFILLSDVISNDYDFKTLPDVQRQQLEADCFWCFSKLLDGIQDNYTFAQPGIQVKIKALSELVSRIDGLLTDLLVINFV